jgi:hypothetical protein
VDFQSFVARSREMTVTTRSVASDLSRRPGRRPHARSSTHGGVSLSGEARCAQGGSLAAGGGGQAEVVATCRAHVRWPRGAWRTWLASRSRLPTRWCCPLSLERMQGGRACAHGDEHQRTVGMVQALTLHLPDALFCSMAVLCSP